MTVKKKYKEKTMQEAYRVFAETYVKTGVATTAYRAAYPNKKLPDATLWTSAWRMSRKAEVKAIIEELRAEIREELNISKERIIAEYAKIGFSDIRNLYDKNSGTFKKITDLDEETAGAISSIEVVEKKITNDGGEIADTVQITKVKLADKKVALDKLGKIAGLFNDEEDKSPVEVVVNNNISSHKEEDLMSIAKKMAFILRKSKEVKK